MTSIPLPPIPCPSSVEPGLLAHLVQTGFGGFYDGIAHWALSPGDVMVVAALSLLAAQNGRARVRQLIQVLPAAWFAAGALMLLAPPASPPAFATVASFGIAGLLVAADRKIPSPAFLVLTLVAAALHGAASADAMRADGWPALAGSTAAVFVAVSLIGAPVVAAQRQAAKRVVRVAGSWIAAAALLMIGWIVRGG